MRFRVNGQTFDLMAEQVKAALERTMPLQYGIDTERARGGWIVGVHSRLYSVVDATREALRYVYGSDFIERVRPGSNVWQCAKVLQKLGFSVYMLKHPNEDEQRSLDEHDPEVAAVAAKG